MKIVRNENANKHKFEDLGIGQVFCEEGFVYMKIQEVYSDSNGETFNAVELENGGLCGFEPNDLVEIVYCELVVS